VPHTSPATKIAHFPPLPPLLALHNKLLMIDFMCDGLKTMKFYLH